jgi:ABC-type transporter Mla subunit MlaD
MRKFITALVVLAAMISVFQVWRKHKDHRLRLVTYFRDATGLKPGAIVRVDGVDAGEVSNIAVRPELGDHPVQVHIALSTPYELVIPNDATVQLGSASVLGPALVDIDTRLSHGFPVKDHGTLISMDPDHDQENQAVRRVANVLVQALKQVQTERQNTSTPSTAPAAK